MKKRSFTFKSTHLIAVCFLIYIFYVGSAATIPFLKNICTASEKKYTVIEFRDMIDTQYESMLNTKRDNPLLKNKSSYIDLNGQMANYLGQQTVNGRVKLTNGHLAEYDKGYSSENITENANNIVRFYQEASALGKDFLFVLAPSQCYGQISLLPVGYTDKINENADAFIDLLSKNNVPYLDLREKMEEQGISYSDAFYVTDHHWTVETGFWAYGEMMKELEQRNIISELNQDLIDPNHYEFIKYENCLLGSSGIRTGRFYAGIDDFSLIVPRFETEISVVIESKNVNKSGRFENVYSNQTLDSFHIKLSNPDLFNDNPYGRIGYGNPDITNWRNENAEEDIRFLLIGDSIGNVPFALMPIYISSCDELDMRNYKSNFKEYFYSYDPDVILICVNAFGLAGSQATNVSYDFSLFS